MKQESTRSSQAPIQSSEIGTRGYGNNEFAEIGLAYAWQFNAELAPNRPVLLERESEGSAPVEKDGVKPHTDLRRP